MLFLGTDKYPDEGMHCRRRYNTTWLLLDMPLSQLFCTFWSRFCFPSLLLDEYEKFLSKYGGFSNAYTDMEDTNYYFSVTTQAQPDGTTTEALEGGLDRLAQFFVSPTFDRDAVDRELKAINSEYTNSKTSDSWRNYQLLKSTCDPRHPFSKFGCGNYETLSSKGLDTLLDELEGFWKTYYQSYNLRLAVVGHASLDNLQRTVERTFGQLPYSEGSPRRVKSIEGQEFTREGAVYGIPAFGPEQLGFVREVIPFQEMRTLKVYFATPPLDDPAIRSTKPYRAISHILGHESPGSLHAALNEDGFLQGLSSGIGIDCSDFSLFSLTLSLTPKGMQNKDKVLDLIFQWVALLRENQDKLEKYHEELRQIAATNFRFRENGDPTDFCSSASELLFDNDTEPSQLLVGQSLMGDFDPKLAKSFLERLRPYNCMITILDSDLDGSSDADESDAGDSFSDWQTEPWYGAKFRTKELSEEQKLAWEFPAERDARLALPALNAYIPSDFSLRCDDNIDKAKAGTEAAETTVPPAIATKDEISAPPNLIVDRPDLRMWHKMDRHWRVPKTFIRVALLSSKSYQTPRSMTLARFFQRVLNDDLNSFVYDASMAGCNYRVSCTPYGYRISVRGYSEKLPFLLDTLTTRILSLIEEMKQGKPSLQKLFDKAKEGLLRETKNYRLDPPYEVASYNSRLLIEENVWYLDNYIDEMEGEVAEKDPLTMAECAEVAQECLMGRVKCEALCMGNIDEVGARQVSGVLDRHFLDASRTLSEAETPRFRSLRLPTRSEAEIIFGKEVGARPFPLVYQDIAYSDSEENNAGTYSCVEDQYCGDIYSACLSLITFLLSCSSVEVILQVGSELELGYEGVAILDLITHMAYNSAYAVLRTKEQLGYIVSAFSRKTAGSTWGFSIVVQGNVALPDVLEERCEAWLKTFREELSAMSPESIAEEASAVVAQLLESETKMSQEITRAWGEILNTEGLSDRLRTPAFDRLEKLARELTIADEEADDAGEDGDISSHEARSPLELKQRILEFYDKYFDIASPHRRGMSARVYSQASKSEYDENVGLAGILSSHSEMRHYKQYMSSWPSVPYWRIEEKVQPSTDR